MYVKIYSKDGYRMYSNVDTYEFNENYTNYMNIFDLGDAEFVINLKDETMVNKLVLTFKGVNDQCKVIFFNTLVYILNDNGKTIETIRNLHDFTKDDENSPIEIRNSNLSEDAFTPITSRCKD